jgi:hypothetical protein
MRDLMRGRRGDEEALGFVREAEELIGNSSSTAGDGVGPSSSPSRHSSTDIASMR